MGVSETQGKFSLQAIPVVKPITARSNRFLPLDVMRGLAALGVLFAHYVVAPDQAGVLEPVASCLAGGGVGVTLFFVLSGYLIGTLLFVEIQRRGRLNAKRFLVRRGLKIWPSYYVYLICYFLWLVIEQGKDVGESVRELIPNLLHIQNYTKHAAGATWTLGIEEHFYLALPLVLLGWSLWAVRSGKDLRGGLHGFVKVSLGVIAVVCLVRWMLYLDPERAHRVYRYTHVKVDALVFGVLLSYASVFHAVRAAAWCSRPGLMFALGMLPGLAYLIPGWGETLPTWARAWWYLLAYGGFGVAIFALVQVGPETGVLGRLMYCRAARVTGWIGLYSYTIYLWHTPFITRPFRRLFHLKVFDAVPGELLWIGGMSVYIATAVFVGWASSRLVEWPVLRLRDRWFPREKHAESMVAEPALMPGSTQPEPLLATRQQQ